jgi:hypothetical protein
MDDEQSEQDETMMVECQSCGRDRDPDEYCSHCLGDLDRDTRPDAWWLDREYDSEEND